MNIVRSVRDIYVWFSEGIRLHLCCDLLLVVDVDLVEVDILKLTGQLHKVRRDHLARSTPKGDSNQVTEEEIVSPSVSQQVRPRRGTPSTKGRATTNQVAPADTQNTQVSLIGLHTPVL